MLSDIDGPGRPEWSPDGQTILFDEAEALWTIPAGGGQPRKLPVVSGRGFDVGSFATWAPDSQRIAFSCNDGICLSDVDSEESTVLTTTAQGGGSPAWQPIPHLEAATPSPATTHTPDQETEDDSSSDLPPCEDNQRGRNYGKTIPGEWLEALLLELGAPGGYPLTKSDVRDTGTALWIDIPEYDNDPTLYATMLSDPFPENEHWEAPEEEIGRQGDFQLFITKGEFAWQSYKARSDQWQLAIIAYPGPDQGEVRWPSGTVQWLSRAAEIAQDSPPRCPPR